MRRTCLLAAAALLGAQPAWAGFDSARAYRWRDVVVGGGGYIPNVVFSPVARGLAYARSDMGGAYRWDAATGRWTPLQDGFAEGSFWGVESLAPDPRDPDRVYAAVGVSRFAPSAILSSQDRGDHWTIVPVAFRMGGNEDGRGLGERLAIDPADPRILYFGSRFDGLQRSTDRGGTWSAVAGWPTRPVPLPSPREPTRAGVSIVLFVPNGEAAGAPTRTILAGLADPGPHHLFRSDDAGATWRAVEGGPDGGLLPMRGALDGRGRVFVTYSDGMGPNGLTRGGVWRLDLRTGAWSDVTPDHSGVPGGYIGLAVDRRHPDVVMAASVSRWKPGDTIWRSTDGGRTWRDLSLRSTRDVSATPFLRWGRPQASFGWWITALAIDPFDSGFAVYGTGATLYADAHVDDADRGRSLTWRPWTRGIEQTAVITLASPAAGVPLLTGFGDISGFAHRRLDVSPADQFTHPVFGNTDTLAVAGRAPLVVVRSGTPEVTREPVPGAPRLAWSGDGGLTWAPLAPPSAPGDAAITVSADGATFVVASDPVQVTRDRGRTWTVAEGLPAGVRPVADPADPQRFYALDFATGRLFVSQDGARRFRPERPTGLPADLSRDRPTNREQPFPLVAAPGRSADLWLATGKGLFRSTDGGGRFTRLAEAPGVTALGFGAPLRSGGYPAAYAIARRGGLTAIWRSEDAGRRWSRINDDAHRYGQRFRDIAGDPRRPGRVYVATDGRGVVYGDDARTTPRRIVADSANR